MCDPISGIIAAISVASSVVSTAASQVAKAEEGKAINEANMYNANMAIKEQNDLSAREGIQQQQERIALANEKMNLKKESMQATATAQASSKSSGAAYDMLMKEYARANANNISVIDQQRSMQDLGHQLAMQSYKDRADARIGSLQWYTPSAAGQALDYLGMGLGIGSAVAGGFGMDKKLTAGRSKIDSPKTGIGTRTGKGIAEIGKKYGVK